MEKNDILNLKKRYLLWLYKETKEALDKVDRKFTQLEIDKFIREELRKDKLKVLNFFEDFNTYVNNKEKDCDTLESREGKYLHSEDQFLFLKLKAIEKAIVKELGAKGLEEIKDLYQKEMVDRILRSTEH